MKSIFKKTKPNDNSSCYIFLNEHDKKIRIEDYLKGYYDSFLIEEIQLGFKIVFHTLEEAIQTAGHYPDNGPQTRYLLKLHCSIQDIKKGNESNGIVNGRPLHELIEEALPVTALLSKKLEKPGA